MRELELLSNLMIMPQNGISEIIEKILVYLPKFNKQKFTKAYEFAKEAHKGQKRRDDSPYIAHPIAVINILVGFHADEDTLIAALLHDVPEDTSRTIDEIQKEFGRDVAFLVDGITKLSKVYYRHDMAERQIESLKKLLIHSAKDPRVILIKLADRLHNMRTLQYVREDKRKRIAMETSEIYVPIANLLGLKEFKNELEDLCLYHLNNEEYEKISKKLESSKIKLKTLLKKTIQLLEITFKKEKIEARIYGRPRSLHTIYKRLNRVGGDINEVQDILTLRVVVKKESHCYKALGVIHGLFKPKIGMFRDYVAVPKLNGYQSLHTTVFGFNGVSTELQIRTEKMHTEAEYGILSRYFSKRRAKSMKLDTDKRSLWVEQILDMQKAEQDNTDFIEDLKQDIFEDRIFVFTPQGDSIDLPRGATCIDFAYAIHTDVGNSAISATINNKPCSLTTMLSTGETVYIETSSKKKCPDLFWLDFAKTNLAKSRIRNCLSHESRAKKIEMGTKILQREFDNAGLGTVNTLNFKKVQNVMRNTYKRFFANRDDLLSAIGDGSIRPLSVVHTLLPNQDKLSKTSKPTRVAIQVLCDDRIGLLRDISDVVVDFAFNIINVKSYYSYAFKEFAVKIDFEVDSFNKLSKLLKHLEQVDGVKGIMRVFGGRQLAFIGLALLTLMTWIAHPFLIRYVLDLDIASHEIWSHIILYFGFLLLFATITLLKVLSKRTLPQFRETQSFWIIIFVLPILAVLAILAEMFFFSLYLTNWPVLLILSVTVFIYVFSEYRNYRKERKLSA